ncbi:hypothetical protein COV19_00095 [Candidatus Woesearchaeota archaeon CG10_big_fil_rev_8_21_14_0_10_44_13]|nr:MAG: hypothetical protein COV19_00095 [Candidatus Woesearchaeota archaeon CG10_big_fil_rev_8_21_14_0_10_44_13]
MTPEKLEEKTEEKKHVKPIVDEALHKGFGITIDEMTRDISEKLERSPLLRFDIDTRVPFKKAKKEFIKRYLQKLLETNYGNVSEAAKVADVDRRSVHRVVKSGKIAVGKIRKDMPRAYDVKHIAISSIIEDVLGNYKTVIHPTKLNEMYRNISDVSREILDAMPEKQLTLKEAEEEFEKEFIRKVLEEYNGNVTRAAKKIKLRYETLLRKVKRYGLG